ncbi:hypothetical protein UK23_15470 [Lentzea aerocolonigenes]|uniref:Uncharacterized protein n=1 Tax=Lentzea aerocolonigenes TaxID=68170 RepID=A0A0F0H242_LENAE|nr:hypothetical protein [Lentzea aerocolonigenes]KJK48921.1 hypothetical protein UK23_15470 [Lentzea aerocolonigenes]
MTAAGVPVPVDVVELVVRLVRRLLAGNAGEIVRGVQVATETGRGHNGGPPSLPWLLVAADDHDWDWPVIQTASIRITCWHRTEHAAKALVALVMGLLCARRASGAFLAAEPDTAPISGVDPHTSAPLAFIVVTVTARASTR